MSDGAPDDLGGLCDEAVGLSQRLAGPLSRIAVRRGDASVEVDWHAPAALTPPATAGTPAAAPPAGSHLGSLNGSSSNGSADRATASGGRTAPTAAAATDHPPTAAGGPPAGDPAASAVHTVLAPLVGTFYRSPSPGAEPFVTVGAPVSVGQSLGIVEAMKMLNPITSDVDGRVVEVVALDGQPVEYEQPLVRVALAAPADAPTPGHRAR